MNPRLHHAELTWRVLCIGLIPSQVRPVARCVGSRAVLIHGLGAKWLYSITSPATAGRPPFEPQQQQQSAFSRLSAIGRRQARAIHFLPHEVGGWSSAPSTPPFVHTCSPLRASGASRVPAALLAAPSSARPARRSTYRRARAGGTVLLCVPSAHISSLRFSFGRRTR